MRQVLLVTLITLASGPAAEAGKPLPGTDQQAARDYLAGAECRGAAIRFDQQKGAYVCRKALRKKEQKHTPAGPVFVDTEEFEAHVIVTGSFLEAKADEAVIDVHRRVLAGERYVVSGWAETQAFSFWVSPQIVRRVKNKYVPKKKLWCPGAAGDCDGQGLQVYSILGKVRMKSGRDLLFVCIGTTDEPHDIGTTCREFDMSRPGRAQVKIDASDSGFCGESERTVVASFERRDADRGGITDLLITTAVEKVRREPEPGSHPAENEPCHTEPVVLSRHLKEVVEIRFDGQQVKLLRRRPVGPAATQPSSTSQPTQ